MAIFQSYLKLPEGNHQPIHPPLQWDFLPTKSQPNSSNTCAPELGPSPGRWSHPPFAPDLAPATANSMDVSENRWRPKVNTWEIYGGFHKLRYAKWLVYSGKSICKWMIWRYPHFRKSYVYILNIASNSNSLRNYTPIFEVYIPQFFVITYSKFLV